MNGTLRLYQSFFPEDKTLALFEATEICMRGAHPGFDDGRKWGATFANGLVLDNLQQVIYAAMKFFPDHYREYCSNPDGRPNEARASMS